MRIGWQPPAARAPRIVFTRVDDGSLERELSHWADASLQKWLLAETHENRLEKNQAERVTEKFFCWEKDLASCSLQNGLVGLTLPGRVTILIYFGCVFYRGEIQSGAQ